MTKVGFLILGGFLLSINSSASDLTEYDMPAWWIDPPRIKGKVVGVGAGEGQPEALTHALGELTGNITLQKDTLPIVAGEYGDITVKHLKKQYDGEVKSSIIEIATRVHYRSHTDTTKTALLKYLVRVEEDVSNPKHNEEVVSFEFTRKNCDLNIILSELKNNDIEIASYESKDGQHFIMLIWTPPKSQ